MTNDRPVFRLDSPHEAAAMTPYLLGYHPSDTLAFLALRDKELLFAGAGPLLNGTDFQPVATHLADVLAAHNVDAAVLIGYGNHHAVTEAVTQCRAALTAAGIALRDTIRVADGRLWHLDCAHPGCPDTGTPFDPATTVAAAHATVLGLVAYPHRDTILAQLDPVIGSERAAMNRALADATSRLTALLNELTARGDDREAPIRQLATDLIAEALAAAEEGGRLPDDRAAMLLLLLAVPGLRDSLLRHVKGEPAQIRAWTDLIRRADCTTTAGPAILLTVAAHQAGHGTLAAVAIRRARDADPDDTLAELLDRAVHHAVDPATLQRILHR
jgi:hypothetical protein